MHFRFGEMEGKLKEDLMMARQYNQSIYITFTTIWIAGMLLNMHAVAIVFLCIITQHFLRHP